MYKDFDVTPESLGCKNLDRDIIVNKREFLIIAAETMTNLVEEEKYDLSTARKFSALLAELTYVLFDEEV